MAIGWGRRIRVDQQKFVAGAGPTAPSAWLAALATANCGDDGQNRTEPTGTGGYQRQAVTWSAVATPSNDAAAVLNNSAVVNFGPSSAAWSTGATNLAFLELWMHLTSTTEANFLGRWALTTPQNCNAAGVNINFAVSAMALTNSPT